MCTLPLVHESSVQRTDVHSTAHALPIASLDGFALYHIFVLYSFFQHFATSTTQSGLVCNVLNVHCTGAPPGLEALHCGLLRELLDGRRPLERGASKPSSSAVQVAPGPAAECDLHIHLDQARLQSRRPVRPVHFRSTTAVIHPNAHGKPYGGAPRFKGRQTRPCSQPAAVPSSRPVGF